MSDEQENYGDRFASLEALVDQAYSAGADYATRRADKDFALKVRERVITELQRRLDEAAKPSKRAQVAEALLDVAALHKDYYGDAANRFRLSIKHINDVPTYVSKEILSRWLERMAAVLEQAAKDEPADGV
jgi:hypothetical protein